MENGELYIPDCLFPTDNPLEIPCLLSDVQPQYIEIPFYCFGEQARTTNMNGRGTVDPYLFRGEDIDPKVFSKVLDKALRALKNPVNGDIKYRNKWDF